MSGKSRRVSKPNHSKPNNAVRLAQPGDSQTTQPTQPLIKPPVFPQPTESLPTIPTPRLIPRPNRSHISPPPPDIWQSIAAESRPSHQRPRSPKQQAQRQAQGGCGPRVALLALLAAAFAVGILFLTIIGPWAGSHLLGQAGNRGVHSNGNPPSTSVASASASATAHPPTPTSESRTPTSGQQAAIFSASASPATLHNGQPVHLTMRFRATHTGTATIAWDFYNTQGTLIAQQQQTNIPLSFTNGTYTRISTWVPGAALPPGVYTLSAEVIGVTTQPTGETITVLP